MKFADKVTMLGRGNSFKASQIIQDRCVTDPIEVLWEIGSAGFFGSAWELFSWTVKNKLSGVTSEMAFDGAFIVIGLSPNTSFLKGSGVRLLSLGFRGDGT